MPASSRRSAPDPPAFNVYTRHERDVLWTPGSEPRLDAERGHQPGSFNAPLVNALRGEARGAEVVVRRDATDGFSGWAGYAFGRLGTRRPQTGESFWADADQRHTLSLYGTIVCRAAPASARATAMARTIRWSGTSVNRRQRSARSRSSMASRCSSSRDERNTLRLPAYSRLDVRADRAFNWSGRRLVLFVDVANVLNHTNLRNRHYFVDRAGRVFETTESLMPIVPSGGFVFEF